MRLPGHVAAHAAGQVGEVAERQKVVTGDFHEGVVAREGVETFDHGVAGRLHPRPRLGGVRPSAGDFAVEGVQGASEILHSLDQRLRDLLFVQLSRARLPHVGGPEVVGQGNARPDLDQAVAQAHGQRVVEAGGEAPVRFQHRLDAHAVENGGLHLFLGDDRSQRLVPPEKGDFADDVAGAVAGDGQGVAAVQTLHANQAAEQDVEVGLRVALAEEDLVPLVRFVASAVE